MIEVVILDDEYLVIEAMKTLIDWGKFHMEIVGCAMDGQAGFDLIVEKKPDIVLTDIRMPLMDGLSIIEKIKYIYPKMQFILFSGYTDFVYAQKAIVLGVLDYIVKPITSVKVEAALEKALSKIDTKDAEQIRQEIQEKLLKGGVISRENWERTNAGFSIEEIKECLVMVCDLPGKNMAVKEYVESREQLVKFGALYTAYPNMQVIMCLSGGNNGKEKMLAALQGVVRLWKKEKEECYIGYAYGQTVQTGIPKVFGQAKEAMSYALFTGEGQEIDYQYLQANKRLPQNIQKYEKKILQSVISVKREQIEETVADFVEECKRLHTEPNVVKHFILEFVYSALHEARKVGEEQGTSSRADVQINDIYECPPHIYVNQCVNMNELTSWFINELKRIADSAKEGEGENKNRSQIAAVLDYIHTNYQKDITLFDLAQISRMTPAYFSNTFKQVVGMAYIKYLTKVRLEKAKEFLAEGYKVNQVSAMVGYENYRYFCVVFKKYTGVTAQQYKGIPGK